MMSARARRLGTVLLITTLMSVTAAQGELIPAPQRVYQALVTHDAAQASVAYQRLGDPATALAYFQAIPDPDADLVRQTAGLALDLRRWDVAQTSLERLLSVATDDSDIAWAHYQSGLLLAATDKQSALTHLQAAWALDATYAQPLLIGTLNENADARALAYEVGTTLADLEQYALAERAFADSAIFAASPADSLASVGLMRALQGLDYQPWVSRAGMLAPNSADVHTLIGLSHRAAGHPFDSLGEFLIALNLTPLDPELNAQVAEAYAVLGDVRSAAFWHGQASALSGDAPRYLNAYHAAQTALPPDSFGAIPITP